MLALQVSSIKPSVAEPVEPKLFGDLEPGAENKCK